MILFLSDHGDGAAAHGWNQKWNLQEEVINVPLIVKSPKDRGCGVVNTAALSNVGLDLYATVCDYAGVAPDPAHYRGRSLRPVAEGACGDAPRGGLRRDAAPGRRDARLEHRRTPLLSMCSTSGAATARLYDLQADPGEMVNLAVDGRYAGFACLRRALYEWGVRIGEQRLVREPDPLTSRPGSELPTAGPAARPDSRPLRTCRPADPEFESPGSTTGTSDPTACLADPNP